MTTTHKTTTEPISESAFTRKPGGDMYAPIEAALARHAASRNSTLDHVISVLQRAHESTIEQIRNFKTSLTEVGATAATETRKESEVDEVSIIDALRSRILTWEDEYQRISRALVASVFECEELKHQKFLMEAELRSERDKVSALSFELETVRGDLERLKSGEPLPQDEGDSHVSYRFRHGNTAGNSIEVVGVPFVDGMTIRDTNMNVYVQVDEQQWIADNIVGGLNTVEIYPAPAVKPLVREILPRGAGR